MLLEPLKDRNPSIVLVLSQILSLLEHCVEPCVRNKKHCSKSIPVANTTGRVRTTSQMSMLSEVKPFVSLLQLVSNYPSVVYVLLTIQFTKLNADYCIKIDLILPLTDIYMFLVQ